MVSVYFLITLLASSAFAAPLLKDAKSFDSSLSRRQVDNDTLSVIAAELEAAGAPAVPEPTSAGINHGPAEAATLPAGPIEDLLIPEDGIILGGL